MLRQVMTGAALLLVGSAASAAEFTDSGIAPGSWFGSPGGSAAAISITQNNDPGVIEALSSIACSAGGITTQNQYLRRFLLNADHGIVDQFTVESVDFGTEACTLPLVCDINIYSIPSGAPFVYANLTLLDSSPIEVTPADVGLFSNVAVGGVFGDPVGTDLVVELVSPDQQPVGGSHFIGANSLGAIGESYIAAADCGITEPTSLSSIGFPNNHYIFVINGDEAGTVPTEDTTWSEVKSLF